MSSQLASLSSSNSERSTTHTFVEDKMTVPIDILAPSSLEGLKDTRPSSKLPPLPSAQRALSHIPATIKDQRTLPLLVEEGVFLLFLKMLQR